MDYGMDRKSCFWCLKRRTSFQTALAVQETVGIKSRLHEDGIEGTARQKHPLE